MSEALARAQAEREQAFLRESSTTAFAANVEAEVVADSHAFRSRVEEHVRAHGVAAFAARHDVRAFMRRHLPRRHTGLLRRPIRRQPRRTSSARRRRTLARAGPRGRPRRRKADDAHHRLVVVAGRRS